MSLTIDTLLKSQGEVHLTEIEVNWYFTPQADEENAIGITGTYNIDSYYDSHITEIQHSRTQITGFYEIFNKLQFTEIATQSSFILGISHITEYEISEDLLTVEFIFHRSIPQIAFNIEQPIIAGVAEIKSSSENLLMFQSLIHKNLHLHFSDHVFKIPRCTRCSSALTVHNKVDLEDEVINEDFVCMDCYTVINNFYNLLENEILKITDPAQMKEQRDVLVKFLITGKKNAAQIEETQLQHFYNLLIIYVEYLSGNLDQLNVLTKIQAVQTIGANQNFPLLQQEAENLLNKISLDRPEEIVEAESLETEQDTWTPPAKHKPEPTPPPIPLGTPSPSTVLPQDGELLEGIQSLAEVQEELKSTLEALSQIESDLRPRPISPTGQIEDLNTDMEEEDSDKIPTFDDIQDTFSDLESIDFPDLHFGTGSASTENSEEITEEANEGNTALDQNEQNLDSEDEYGALTEEITEDSPAFLNFPPGNTQDYTEESASAPSFNMPPIQDLPEPEASLPELEDDELDATQISLNPPPGSISEKEFTGSGTIKPMRDLEFGEEGGLDAEVNEDNPDTVHLNPPSTLQDNQMSAEMRDLSETIPQPQMNPPPPTVSIPQMKAPPIKTPPPQMNPPPGTELPPTTAPPLEETPGLEEHLSPKPPKLDPKLYKKQAFFINGNGNHNQSTKQQALHPAVPNQPTPSPGNKSKRAKRGRNNKIRKIICSFCGHTMTQGRKQCPNCGSAIK